MKRELFSVWEDMDDIGPFPFRAQLVNYVGRFPSRQKAESFVATTKKLRAQAEKSVTKSR